MKKNQMGVIIMPFNKEQLKQDLKMMGMEPTDAVMVHSSMKSVGDVEGGADTVIDAFMEYFSEGLFMTPAHTWAQMSAEYSVFDPASEPACVGIIPNLFLKREGVVRSLHPTHSIAAFGQHAGAYIAGEEHCTTPCTPGGCWDRLRKIRAKILLVGVTHIRNTFIHSVEEVYEVPERLTAEPVLFQIRMPDGSLKPVAVHRHYNPTTPHISEAYDKLIEAFEGTGVTKNVKFGDADCILCDAEGMFEVVGKILRHERNCLIERDCIPQEWWKE